MQLITLDVYILSVLTGVLIGCILGMAIYLIIDKKKSEEKSNYNRIQNMSVEELASFICGIYDYEYDSPIYNETENGKHICGDFIPVYDEECIKQWLEAEVT